MHQLQEQKISESFRTVSLRPSVVPMGHVLNVDHFHMSQPTFPPHPHAGFSAVTWMMPWSAGGFVNRDSLGDRSIIAPGTLHWTCAGSGMMHEEIPEVPGTDCEGLQIFVKLAEPEELRAPSAFHLTKEQVPTVQTPAAVVRLLVGRLDDLVSPLPVHTETTLAHASLTGAWSLSVPENVEAFALVLRGAGKIDGQSVSVHQALPLVGGSTSLEGEGLEVLFGWSGRMARPPRFSGPFCLFGEDRLAEAFQRFRSGKMGSLAPTPS